MTQVTLAEKLGMSQSLLSRYERGGLRLHGSLVVALAKALNATTDELLGVREIKGNGLQDGRFAKRLQHVERLSERRKQALLMMMDAFLREEHRT